MQGGNWVWIAMVLSAAPIVLSACNGGGPKANDDFPKLWLSNGEVKLMLYMPAGAKSYYVGSRFERSGVVGRAEYKGHVFFGPWQRRDVTTPDHIMGTAEEFSMFRPLGFDEVAAGGVFYKIGVGGLVRVEKPQRDEKTGKMVDQPFGFMLGHKVAQPATWQVRHGIDWVEFEQAFRGDRGWGWHYRKRLALADSGATFTISRELENTGTKAIDTTHYCHHFTIIDDVPVGPDYRIRFPFQPTAKTMYGDAAKIDGRQLVFVRELKGKATVWADLVGFGAGAADHAVVIENVKTGASLAVTGDTPLKWWRFWAIRRAACPEPFVDVKLAPGASMKWSNTYTFHVRDEKQAK